MITSRESVGLSLPKIDAIAKVTGRALYTADLMLPGMLHARFLRSPHAHARIKSVDTSAAAAVPGVVAILTAWNSPGPLFTNSKWDATAIARLPHKDQRLFDRKVRYAGEPVAIVAATTVAAAEEAVEAIRVEYEPLPVGTDPVAALAPGAPLVHEERESNLAATLPIRVGDIAAGFAAADIVIERRFQTSRQKQAQTEPYACIAAVGPDGALTVWTPNQTPHLVRLKLADMFGLPASKVRVVVPHVGGAFGGRGGLVAEPWVAALALKTRRPVKLVFDRAEDFIGTEARHPMSINVKLGARRDGTLTALHVQTYVNAGAYLTVSPNVTGVHGYNCLRLYRCPNRWFDGFVVYTNTPVSGAFRGFGAPQAVFAVEQVIDELAGLLNRDPLELRRQLILQKDDIDPWTGLPLISYGLDQCIEAGARAIGWSDRHRRKAQSTGRWRRGTGMALLIWVSGTACLGEELLEGTAATVRFNVDGSVELATGATDLGTGVLTTLRQIAAEELGLAPEMIQVVAHDTQVTPFDAGAHASRSLFNCGNAVRLAAADARRQMLQVAAGLLEADPADLVLSDGQVFVKGAPNRSMPLAQVARIAYRQLTEVQGRASAPQVNAPGFAAHFAEVEVNTETGEVRILRYVAAHDVGRAINPTIVEGQLEGGIVQGLGYALCEHLHVDPETGTVLNASFMDYKLMTAADVPPIDLHIVEVPDPNGPYGAKGVGEPGLVPVAATVANAVADAIGCRVHQLPLTAERVLEAWHEALKQGGEM